MPPTVELPPALAPDRLADACREVAVGARVQPFVVEKDYYLTRLIWGIRYRTNRSSVISSFFSKRPSGQYCYPSDARRFDRYCPSGKSRAPTAGLSMNWRRGRKKFAQRSRVASLATTTTCNSWPTRGRTCRLRNSCR